MTNTYDKIIGGFLDRWVDPKNHEAAKDELVYGIIQAFDRVGIDTKEGVKRLEEFSKKF